MTPGACSAGRCCAVHRLVARRHYSLRTSAIRWTFTVFESVIKQRFRRDNRKISSRRPPRVKQRRRRRRRPDTRSRNKDIRCGRRLAKLHRLRAPALRCADRGRHRPGLHRRRISLNTAHITPLMRLICSRCCCCFC